MDQGEDGRVGTDSERQGQHRCRGESGTLAQLAGCVVKVSNQRLQQGKPALNAIRGLGLFQAAEADQCLPSRLLRIQAGTDSVFDVHLKMSFQFGIELSFRLPYAEGCPQPQPQCPDLPHQVPFTGYP